MSSREMWWVPLVDPGMLPVVGPVRFEQVPEALFRNY